jgi:sigma-B regulation protein RsbU (phosphoserine phosphatase)
MGRIMRISGLRLKVLVLLLAFALIPVVSLGLFSLMEMNQATKDVQEKVSGLSSTLNRSTLSAASNEADQVQIAVAKASQYDEFFKRIQSENEIVAAYASNSDENGSCELHAGIWIAPWGANATLKKEKAKTLSLLCRPASLLQSVIEAEPASILGFIGTEDGIMVTWPDINHTLSRIAPYDHRNMLWYSAAKAAGKTVWTRAYVDSRGAPAITCTTPVRRSSGVFGVAGINVSLAAVYSDLSSAGGRGYPFIIDESGDLFMRPQDRPKGELERLFLSDNFYESNSSEIRELVRNMLHGETGSSVIGLGKTDGFVAYAPITTLGWSFGIAYPAEEMSLPARFIDAGIKNTAQAVTKGLTDAIGFTEESVIIIVILTFIIALASAVFIGRKVESQAKIIEEMARRIRNGDLEMPESSSGDPGIFKEAFSGMAEGIKQYMAEHEASAANRGALQKEIEVLKEIKRTLGPGQIRQPEGYEIAALSMPSFTGGFDFYDVLDLGGEKIALTMAEVSEGGIAGAMLATASRAMIRSSSQSADPALAISDVNHQLSANSQGMNLACFYAVLDIKDNILEFVNAGFNPAFIVDFGGSVDTLGGGGIALGALDRLDLRPERIPVQPGDVLMVYSDGVTEATNAWRMQQGAERLITVVKDNRSNRASEILAAIENEMRAYLKNNPLKDDLTLIILKRLQNND